MDSRIVTSPDEVIIAYEVQATGPPLILLHGGFIQDRRSWHEAGYIERLSRDFTLITPDLRGHGESDKPTDATAYALDRIMNDVLAVADACGASGFGLWGFSFGATIAMQIAAKTKRVARAVLAGSFFGSIFVEEEISRTMAAMRVAVTAKEQGRLHELPLSPEQRLFAEQTDLRIPLAIYDAMILWPRVGPGDLKCPTLVYAGTADELIARKLTEQREDIEAAGLALALFDGLNHIQEFTEVDIVLPPARAFLRGGIPSLTVE